MRRDATSNLVLRVVRRVTPCAPLSMQAERRAEDCAPYQAPHVELSLTDFSLILTIVCRAGPYMKIGPHLAYFSA